MAEVEQKGFFIMDTGERSCDVIIKKKVKRGGEPAPKMRERGTQTDLKMFKKGASSMMQTQELDVTSPDQSPAKTKKRKLKDMAYDEDGEKGNRSPSPPPKKRAKVTSAKDEPESRKSPV